MKFIEIAPLKEKSIDVINKHNLIFIEDVCAYLGVSKTTFYEKFPLNLNDYNDISALLEQNKINIKVSIRHKWSISDNPTAQMALYKLCSNVNEHKLLQQNYVQNEITQEHTYTIVELPAKDALPDFEKANKLLDEDDN